MTLTPFAQMLEESDSVEVELSLIDAFPEHPFRVQADEDMERLIASIQESGVLVPVILRRSVDGWYQTIAGHRRCFACRQLSMERIPADIKEITDEEAVVWMVESNIQRTNILPSEKAKAYRMKMEALAKQGKRTDLAEDGRLTENGNPAENGSSRQPVGRWQKETAEQVGLGSGDSGRKVQRYLRLNHLIPGLLEMVDGKKLPFLSGVELSYLPERKQRELLKHLEEHPHSITVRQAKQIRTLGEQAKLTPGQIPRTLERPAKEKKDRGRGKDPFQKYFPESYTKEERQKIMEALLKKWKKGEIAL